jgi:hypothetical protein
MAAGMHHALCFRSPRYARQFFNGQSIHIGSQANDLTACPSSTMDDAHYAGSADAGCYLIAAEVFEFCGDKRGCSANVKLELRVSMKVTSPFNYLTVL